MRHRRASRSGCAAIPDGFRQLAAGWTKNIASGASAARPPAPRSPRWLWVSAHHAVAAGAVLSLVEAVTGRRRSPAPAIPLLWTVGWVGLAWQLRSILRRIGSFRWWTWALVPASRCSPSTSLFARSAVLTVVRRSVRWRGRDVDLRAGGSGREAA